MDTEDIDHAHVQGMIRIYEKKVSKLESEALKKRMEIARCKEKLRYAEHENNEVRDQIVDARAKLKQLRGFEKLDIAKSRWGYHPCHYEHYLKLKFLHRKYWQAIYKMAEYERWVRKAPQNRVIRKTIRDQDGRKIGSQIISSRPAPPLCPVFTFKSKSRADFGYLAMKGTLAREYEVQEKWGDLGWVSHYLWIYDPGVLKDYWAASTPVQNLMEMKPLILTAEAVDQLCARFPDNPFGKHPAPKPHPLDLIAYMAKHLPLADPEEEAAFDRKLNELRGGEKPTRKIERRLTDDDLMSCVGED